MNATAWERTKQTFFAVASLPPEERSRALDELCLGDPCLRADVQCLLAADAAAPSAFLEPAGLLGLPPLPELMEDSTPSFPFRVRDYEFESVLGAGRSGVVYGARQHSMHRDVAIKVLSPSLRPGGITTRLRREIVATGRVRHHGIAKLFSVESLPWPDGTSRWALVMELVRGQRLSGFAHAHRLSLGQILELVLQVCDALAAAHRAGVIHHDVKPANILVEDDAGKARVRLVDFGISALIGDAKLAGSEVYGSLKYTAPERLTSAPNESFDVRSDVFSLGVVLAELLGSLGQGTAIGTIAAAISPSTGPFGSDLDLIIAKATAHEPADRYGTVEALADDLRRFRDKRPISARRPAPVYVTVRLIQRNPMFAALLGLAVVAGASMIGVQIKQSAKTELARQEARQAAGLLLNEVAENIRDEIGASAKRQALLVRLLPTLEQFAARYPDDPRTQADLATLLASLGDVLQERGDHAQAQETLKRAWTLRARLAKLLPDDSGAQADLSIAMVRLGDSDVPHERETSSVGWYRDAFQLDKRLVARWPHEPRLLSNLAFSCERLAWHAVDQILFSEASEYSRQQLEVTRNLLALEPKSERALRTIVAALATQSAFLSRRKQDTQAMALLSEQLGYLRELDAMAPNQRGINKQIIDTVIMIATIHEKGIVSAGTDSDVGADIDRLLMDAVARSATLAAEDPSDPYAWDLSMRSLTARRDYLTRAHDLAGAAKLSAEIRRVVDSAAVACDGCPASQRLVVNVAFKQARVAIDAGQLVDASGILRAAIPKARELFDRSRDAESAASITQLHMALPTPTDEERLEALKYARVALRLDPRNRLFNEAIVAEALARAGLRIESKAAVSRLRKSIPPDEASLNLWIQEVSERCERAR